MLEWINSKICRKKTIANTKKEKKMATLAERIPAGVLTGDFVQEVFADAKARGYALPAANTVGTNSVNSVMETAAAVNSPVILQLSRRCERSSATVKRNRQFLTLIINLFYICRQWLMPEASKAR